MPRSKKITNGTFYSKLLKSLHGKRRSIIVLIILIVIICLAFTLHGNVNINFSPPLDNSSQINRIQTRQPNLDKITSLTKYYSLTGPNSQTDKGYYNTSYKPEALVISCYVDTGDPVVTYESIHEEFIADSWQWISQDPQNPSNPEDANTQKIINDIRSGEALFTTEYFLRPANEGKYTDFREDLSFFTFQITPDTQLKYDVCEMKGLSEHIKANTHILETYTTLSD